MCFTLVFYVQNKWDIVLRNTHQEKFLMHFTHQSVQILSNKCPQANIHVYSFSMNKNEKHSKTLLFWLKCPPNSTPFLSHDHMVMWYGVLILENI